MLSLKAYWRAALKRDQHDKRGGVSLSGKRETIVCDIYVFFPKSLLPVLSFRSLFQDLYTRDSYYVP